jgi:LuxR family maltose regulon positive regulatory protein
MPFPLLATKLYLPSLRPNRVSRPRLLERLNQGLLPGVRLVLVSAPAGFGKTTLASEWARASGLTTAWLSLDEADNDPVRFWHYAVAALQTVEPALGQAMAAALDTPAPPPIESLLALLVNDLIQAPRELLWILDDYYLVENQAIHAGMQFLIDHLPPHVRLALLTRSDPPFQLARRRARAELVELRAGDLRFSEGEAQDFFQHAMRLGLAAEDVAALEERTEGWVAGLQMAALALQSQPGESHRFIAAFTGDDRYIADYLVEEVLDRQPPEVQQFLLRTAVLKRFSAGLCDALIAGQGAERAAGPGSPAARLLDYLDRANLFLVALDNRREWFRYHHLFAQLLRQRAGQVLDAGLLRELYQRAAQWHLSHGDPGEAVEYALAGGETELAASLMEQVAEQMFLIGELTTMQHWAERLPRSVLGHHPSLCVALAWATNATGYVSLCEELIGLAESASHVSVAEFMALDDAARRRLPPEKLGAVVELTVQRARLSMDRGEIAAILDRYAFILDYLVVERNDQPHIFNLPMVLRPPMVFMIAMAHELLGQVEPAVALFEEAADLGERLFNIHIVALALGHLGQIQAALGRLRAAEATFRRDVAYAEKIGEHLSAFFGLAHIGLGGLAYERNELETARRELEQGIRQGKLWNSWELQLPGYEGLIRLALAEGRPELAEAALAGLEALVKTVPAVAGPLAAAWRAQLKPERAAQWAQAAAARLPDAPTAVHALEAVLLARFWLAKGQPAPALELLAAQAASAKQAGQASAWLRLEVLRAVALQAAGQPAEAAVLLASLLEQAENEGYVRTFLDEGEPMAGLLRGCVESGACRGYAVRLLAASGWPAGASAEVPPGSAPAQQAGLPEALSPRELEILRLLAGDASNADIAQRCFITVNTLKKHISSIYGKLGVTTRLQAVQRARLLNLI